MKQLLIVLALGLCAGCNHSHDEVKLKSLTARLDYMEQTQLTILSNQFGLNSNLMVIASRLDAIPTTKQMDSMAYYYHSNLFDRLDQKFAALSEINRLASEQNAIVFTNVTRIQDLLLSKAGSK